MIVLQSEEYARGVRIPQGRSYSCQEGQEYDSICSGLGFLGFLIDYLVGTDSSFAWVKSMIRLIFTKIPQDHSANSRPRVVGIRTLLGAGIHDPQSFVTSEDAPRKMGPHVKNNHAAIRNLTTSFRG